MKIVKIMGGLGNQMAQYAFARLIKEKLSEEVLLDLSWFEEIKDLKEHPTATQRKFVLDRFNISLEIATVKQVKECINEKKSKLPSFICKLLKTPKHTSNIVHQEDTAAFIPELFEYKGDVYYIGYFQSKKYFNNVRNELLREFSLKENVLDEKNRELLLKIRDTNSVSLHVRRGDYVSNPAINASQGICSLDYYKKAIEHIVSRVDNVHFYLFSDDIKWVEENLKINYPFTVVDINNEETCYLDMELMKNCKHNIIANSSFSWCGAWLNQNENKIIIAPQKWTNNKNLNTNDFLLESWIKV